MDTAQAFRKYPGITHEKDMKLRVMLFSQVENITGFSTWVCVQDNFTTD